MNEVYEIMARLGLHMYAIHRPEGKTFVFHRNDMLGPTVRCDDPMQLIEAAVAFESRYPLNEVRLGYNQMAQAMELGLGYKLLMVRDVDNHEHEDALSALNDVAEDRVADGPLAVGIFDNLFESMKP